MNNKLIKLLSLAILLGTVGCGDNGSSNPPDDADYNLDVKNDSITLVEGVSEKETLSIVTKVNDEDSTAGTLTYTSSDESVATVDQFGAINYAGFGSCKIKVSWTVGKLVLEEYASVECYEEVSFNNINTFDEKYITTQGRTYVANDYLVLDNTANGFDIGFFGSELILNAKGDNKSAYIHTYIDDDKEGSLLNINSSNIKDFTIASGLENTFHKLRVIKATSTTYGRIYVNQFVEGPKFYKAPQKDLTIEFLGDSISCGYGNLGKASLAADSSLQDAGQAFPYLTSSELDANFSVLALEGICAKDGSPNIYNKYDKYSFNNPNTYDCANYPADVVVIGLGENDVWHATDNSFSYTVDQFKEDYCSLIKLVRSYHPTSYIVCMYGMMHCSGNRFGRKAITEAITNSEDTNIISLKVTTNESGSETHPDVAGHKSFADDLVAVIKEYLNK